MQNIEVIYKGETLFETILGNNKLQVDSSGVKGPSPPHLMLASMAACSGALVSGYCRNTGLNAEGMTVALEFEKAEGPYRFTNFRMRINLPNVKDAAKKEAILRVAEHCPVHETMKHYDGIKYDVVLD